jgi:hypothetical protein
MDIHLTGQRRFIIVPTIYEFIYRYFSVKYGKLKRWHQSYFIKPLCYD